MEAVEVFDAPKEARSLARTIRSLGVMCRDLCPGSRDGIQQPDSYPTGLQLCPNPGACERAVARSLTITAILDDYANSIELFLRTSLESKAHLRDAFEARLYRFASQNVSMMKAFAENCRRRALRYTTCSNCKSRREILDLVLVCDSTHLPIGPTKDILEYATAVADVYTAVFR